MTNDLFSLAERENQMVSFLEKLGHAGWPKRWTRRRVKGRPNLDEPVFPLIALLAPTRTVLDADYTRAQQEQAQRPPYGSLRGGHISLPLGAGTPERTHSSSSSKLFLGKKMLRHLHQMVPATGPVKRKRKAEHHRHNSSTSLCKKPAPPRHDLDVTFDRACSIHGRVSPTDIAATATTVDSPRQGDVNGSIFHRAGDQLCFVAVGEETTSTDDESELSSTDGRSSPSHPHPAVSWGPASSNQGATGFVPDCFQAPLGVGYVTPRAIGVAMETPLAATAAVSTRGRKVCSSSSSSGGESTGASCVYGVGAPIGHQYQQQQQQHQYQQQLEQIYEEEQQHLQGHGPIQQQVVRDGGRADADVWGWFVDAGDELQPSRANSVQNRGVGVRYY